MSNVEVGICMMLHAVKKWIKAQFEKKSVLTPKVVKKDSASNVVSVEKTVCCTEMSTFNTIRE